jgi:hypothetical protein
MPSNINTAKININFPVPGKDNDTQGFRTNFSEIKLSLDTAEQEITDLQNITVKSNQDNNLQSSKIINGDFQQSTISVYDLGNINSDSTIDWMNGSFQTVNIGADLFLTVQGWPDTGRFADILVLISSDAEFEINWRTPNGDAPKVDSSVFPQPFALNSSSNVIVRIWTADGGNTVFADYLGEYS